MDKLKLNRYYEEGNRDAKDGHAPLDRQLFEVPADYLQYKAGYDDYHNSKEKQGELDGSIRVWDIYRSPGSGCSFHPSVVFFSNRLHDAVELPTKDGKPGLIKVLRDIIDLIRR